MLEPLTELLPINGIELCCGLLFLCLAGIWIRTSGRSVQRTLLLTVVLSVPAFLSVERATQFMTIDETGLTNLLLTPQDRAHQQMVAGAFRTTLPAALPMVRAMESAGFREDSIRMMLKGAHWLIAAILIFAIHVLIAKLGDFDAFDPPFFVLSMSCLLLLPVTNMAIKTFNYDAISMLGSVLALLLVCLAFAGHWRAKVPASFAAIVAAALAAQEKLSASPILCVALLAYALLSAQRASDHPMVAAVRAMVTGICLAALLAALSTLVYAIGYSASLPGAVWMGVADGFSSWAWIPIQILSGKGGGEVPGRLAAVALAITLLMAAAAAAGKFAGSRPRLLRFGPTVVASSTLMGLAAGLLSTAVLQPFWAPFHPSAVPESFVMNGIWLHFGLDSGLLTRLAYIGYAFEVMVVAMPTLILGLVVLAGISMVVRRGEEDGHAGFLMGVALVLVLTGAVLEVPLANRYLNIPLLLLMLAALLVIFSRLNGIASAARASSPLSVVVACICALVLVWEVLPFRPLFAAFRPFWLNYDDGHFAEPGRLNPSWMGWGEERALLGREFEKWCATSIGGCADVRVFHLYYGRWLPERDRPFAIHDWADVAGKEPLGDKDFYMFSRTRIVQGTPQPKAKPIVVLAFRGYEMAWIYRGSDLAREDYRFGRP